MEDLPRELLVAILAETLPEDEAGTLLERLSVADTEARLALLEPRYRDLCAAIQLLGRWAAHMTPSMTSSPDRECCGSQTRALAPILELQSLSFEAVAAAGDQVAQRLPYRWYIWWHISKALATRRLSSPHGKE